jgi:hypothetical protein
MHCYCVSLPLQNVIILGPSFLLTFVQILLHVLIHRLGHQFVTISLSQNDRPANSAFGRQTVGMDIGVQIPDSVHLPERLLFRL